MQLVLSTFNLRERSGSQTYLLVVAVELQRLGHDVVVHAEEVDAKHGLTEGLGLRTAVGGRGLPTRPDAIVAQDATMAYRLAEIYPDVPQLFVAHSAVHDLQFPPQLAGVVSGVVALNDRVAARMRTMALDVPVTRLRQPVHFDQFAAPGPLPARPRRLLVMSHRLSEARRAPMRAACAELGIEYAEVGRQTAVSADPAGLIAQSDIVIGYGRCIVEAMAGGRAAYVYDYQGADGWVTAETYAALEADGFAGSSSGGRPRTDEDIRRDLAAYSRDMGAVNRNLVLRHHTVAAHAVGLLELLQQVVKDARPPELAGELARLVRENWRRETYHLVLGEQRAALETQLREVEAERDQARARLEAAAEEAEVERDRLAGQLARAHAELEAIERRRADELDAELQRRRSLERSLAEAQAEIDASKGRRRFRTVSAGAVWRSRLRAATKRSRG